MRGPDCAVAGWEGATSRQPPDLSTICWMRSRSRQTSASTAIVSAVPAGLDLGFLFLYRSGFEVSLGALVTQSAAALLLLAIGVTVFGERLSPTNVLGLVLCLVGLWLVNRR